MMEQICCVSVDLDTLRCYLAIHGLPVSGKEGEGDPIYTHAMPRIFELFARWGIRGTFFVIGKDATHPIHQAVLREAVSRGHELANHSFSHPYSLVRLEEKEVETEIAQAEEAIGALLADGSRVVGFRAPGYNINSPIVRALRRRGYSYDSSVFPCWPYYAAKGTVMGWLALRGTPSRSVLGDPRVLLAPITPYRPGEDPHQPIPQTGLSAGLWEIPIGVLPGWRFPYIGTWLLLYPLWLLPWCNQQMIRHHRLINLELHGIDLIDPDHDPVPASLYGRQPDLRFSLADKQRRFALTFEQIRQTHRFLPLAEATTLLPRSE